MPDNRIDFIYYILKGAIYEKSSRFLSGSAKNQAFHFNGFAAIASGFAAVSRHDRFSVRGSSMSCAKCGLQDGCDKLNQLIHSGYKPEYCNCAMWKPMEGEVSLCAF